MLRGAGLMSQASGLGPASARTITDAPNKVRLCRHCILLSSARLSLYCTTRIYALFPPLNRDSRLLVHLLQHIPPEIC